MRTRLAVRIEELRAHLVTCASCTTCEATTLAEALSVLLEELDGADEGATWSADDVRAVLGEVLL